MAETSRHDDADDEAQRMSRRRPSISTQPRLCSSAALVSSSRAASNSSFSAASFSACCLKRKTHYYIDNYVHNVRKGPPILTSHSRHRAATGLAPPSRTLNSPSAIAALILRRFYVNNEVEAPNKYTKYQPKCLTF